jgi:hypothetical protein
LQRDLVSRPSGRQCHGVSLSIDIVGKQIELLKAVVPGLSHAALLWNPDNATYQALQLREAERAARTAGGTSAGGRAIGERNPESRRQHQEQDAGHPPFLVTQCWCSTRQQSPSLR